MSALTPDCDPDLSNCGSPVDGASGARGGPSLRSTLVLLAVLAGSVLLATGEAVPGAVAFLGGGVALVSGLVLVRRGVRLARSVGAAAPGVVAVRRSRPVG
ncbi:hypothetical protein ACI79C_20485 [Geodermatophilus sp. SYSU D00697]